FDIAKYLSRRNAECLDAAIGDESIALCVALRTSSAIMRFTVNLDREPGCWAEEVEHVVARRVLTPELVSAWPLLESLPQHRFGRRHRAAHRSSPQHGLVGLGRKLIADPSTTLRVVPLPICRWGGIFGPAEGGERPEGAGEPSIEDVFVAGQLAVFGEGLRLLFGLGDEHVALLVIPSRY